jgi:hypothetical protein
MAVSETLSSATRGVVYGTPKSIESVVFAGTMLAAGVIPKVMDHAGAQLINIGEKGVDRTVGLPEEDHL